MSDAAGNTCISVVEVLIHGPQGPAGSGGAAGIGPHAVEIANAVEGEVIAFSGTVWENRSLPPGGDMVKAVYDTNGDGKVDAADVADRVAWAGVEDKPETFPPSVHGHAVADVVGLGDALAAKADASLGGTLTLLIRDAFRQSVEAASGGVNTVLYDDAGNPSVMYVLPRFNLEDIDVSLGAGTHPAFVVNGVAKSEIFIGKFLASIVGGTHAVSMPGVDPAASINFDTSHARCTAKGPGWHMMTNAEWAAVALWAWKNGLAPRGNTNWGRSHERRHETGRLAEGGAPGVNIGTGRTRTGSGPAGWSHDGTSVGIIDLVGNVWEWQRGLRLVDGEIQIIPDNNAANPSVDHGAGSAAWRAILQDGSLVAPGTVNTLKYDTPANNVRLNAVVSVAGNTSALYTSMTATAGVTAPAILKALGLFPHAASGLAGIIYANSNGEYMALRGGSRSIGAGAGTGTLGLTNSRSDALAGYGFRPAFAS